MRIDPQDAKKWERRRSVPLSTGHLPDRPQIDGYSKGCENLRAWRAGFNPPITPSRRSPSCIARFQPLCGSIAKVAIISQNFPPRRAVQPTMGVYG
jgi:hypothetical protein